MIVLGLLQFSFKQWPFRFNVYLQESVEFGFKTVYSNRL